MFPTEYPYLSLINLFLTTHMKTAKLLLLGLLLFPVLNQAQKRKKNKKSPAIVLNDSVFHGLKWRNIGPFRGGRSVASSGVVGQPMTYYTVSYTHLTLPTKA